MLTCIGNLRHYIIVSETNCLSKCERITAVSLKITVFLKVTQCSLVKT